MFYDAFCCCCFLIFFYVLTRLLSNGWIDLHQFFKATKHKKASFINFIRRRLSLLSEGDVFCFTMRSVVVIFILFYFFYVLTRLPSKIHCIVS